MFFEIICWKLLKEYYRTKKTFKKNKVKRKQNKTKKKKKTIKEGFTSKDCKCPDTNAKKGTSIVSGIIQIILMSVSIYLCFKRNNGLNWPSLIVAICCPTCYLLYALAVPINTNQTQTPTPIVVQTQPIINTSSPTQQITPVQN